MEFNPSSSSSVISTSFTKKLSPDGQKSDPQKVDVTFNGRPMSVEDQGASVGKEGKTKLFSLVRVIMTMFVSSVRSSNSHPDLLLTQHHPPHFFRFSISAII